MFTTLRVERRLEWFVINVRWGTLAAALGMMMQVAHPLSPLGVGLIGLTLLYTVGLTVLEFVEYRVALPQTVTVALDMAAALSLFAVSFEVNAPLYWIGLWPAWLVALRYVWWRALIAIAVFTGLQAFTLYWVSNPNASLSGLVTTALFTFPLTVIAAWIASRLRRSLHLLAQREQDALQQQTEFVRQQARASYELTNLVSAQMDETTVLDTVLRYGALGSEGPNVGQSQLVSAVLVFETDLLSVSMAFHLPEKDWRVICPGREGALGETIRLGQSTLAALPMQDPELKQFAALQVCQVALVLPLRVGYETIGALVHAHPDPDFFDDDRRAFFEALANQAMAALQNAQLVRKLREEKTRLIEVQEEARRSLASNLHDGPTQNLAAIAMRANFARRLAVRDPGSALDELAKMEDLARSTTQEMRHMLFTLRPLVLDTQGLVVALQQLAEKTREIHDQHVEVEPDAAADQLDKSQQAALFYIIEEAVNNARKHAQAQHIWIRLKTENGFLLAEVQDDGLGFHLGSVDANYERRGSLGMVHMRERAEILGGSLTIETSEGRGTRVIVKVPLKH